jgi:DNA-binding CsgD family transcriptional regulator
VRVLVAVPRNLLGEGVSIVLGRAPDIEIAGAASEAPLAVAMAIAVEADVVVLGNALAGAAKAAADLRAARPWAGVVLVGGAGDAGAGVACVPDGADAAGLVAAVRAAAPRGGARIVAPPAAVAAVARLSPREREAVRLVAAGHTNRSVAAVMGISVKTAEGYRERAATKLDARGRAELVRIAVMAGLLPGGDARALSRSRGPGPRAGRGARARRGGAAGTRGTR